MPPRKSQAAPLRPEVQKWNATVEDVKKALDKRKGEKNATGLQGARESFCKGAKILLKLLNDPSFPEKLLKEFQSWSEDELPNHQPMIDGPAFAQSLLSLLTALHSLATETAADIPQPGSSRNAAEQGLIVNRILKAVRLIILIVIDGNESANTRARLSSYEKDKSPYIDREWFDLLLSLLEFVQGSAHQHRETTNNLIDLLETLMSHDLDGKYQTWGIDVASVKARLRLGSLIMESKGAILSLYGLRTLIWSFINADPLRADEEPDQSRYRHLVAALSSHPSWKEKSQPLMRAGLKKSLAGLPTKVSKKPRTYMHMINAIHTIDENKPEGFPLTSCVLSREDLSLISNDHARKRLKDGDLILYIDESGIYINDFSEDRIEEPCFIAHYRAIGCFRHDDPNPNRFEWTLNPIVPGGQDCLVTVDIDINYADKFEAALKKWFPPATWLAAVHQIGNPPPDPAQSANNSHSESANVLPIPLPKSQAPDQDIPEPDNDNAAPDNDNPGPDDDQDELVPDSSPQRKLGPNLSSIATHASDSFGPLTAPDGRSQRNVAGLLTRGRPPTRGQSTKGVGRIGADAGAGAASSLPLPPNGKKSTKASAKAAVVDKSATAPAQVDSTSKGKSKATSAAGIKADKAVPNPNDNSKSTSSTSRPSRAAKSASERKTADVLGGEAVPLPDVEPVQAEVAAVEVAKTPKRRGRPPKVPKEAVIPEAITTAGIGKGDDANLEAFEEQAGEDGGEEEAADKAGGVAEKGEEELVVPEEEAIPEVPVSLPKKARGRPKGKGKTAEKGKAKAADKGKDTGTEKSSSVGAEEEVQPETDDPANAEEAIVDKEGEKVATKSKSTPLAQAASLQDIPSKEVDVLSRSGLQYSRDKPTSSRKEEGDEDAAGSGSEKDGEDQADNPAEAPIVDTTKAIPTTSKATKSRQTPSTRSANPRDKTTPLAETSANILPKPSTRAKVTLKPKQPKETLAAAIKAGQAMTPDKVQEKLASAGKKKTGSEGKEMKGKKGPPKAVIPKKASTAPGQIEDVNTSEIEQSSVAGEGSNLIRPEEEAPIPHPAPKKAKSVTPPSVEATRTRLPRDVKAQSARVEDETEEVNSGDIGSVKDDDPNAAPGDVIPDEIVPPAVAIPKPTPKSKAKAKLPPSNRSKEPASPAVRSVSVPILNASPLKSALRKLSQEVPIPINSQEREPNAESPTSRRYVAFSDPIEPVEDDRISPHAKSKAVPVEAPAGPSTPSENLPQPALSTKEKRNPKLAEPSAIPISTSTERKAKESLEDVPQSASKKRQLPVEQQTVQQPKSETILHSTSANLPQDQPSKVPPPAKDSEEPSKSPSVTRAQRDAPLPEEEGEKGGKKRKVSIQEPDTAERETSKRRKVDAGSNGREDKGKRKSMAIDGVLTVIDDIANLAKRRISERLSVSDKVISSIDHHVNKVARQFIAKFGIDHTSDSLRPKIDNVNTKQAELQVINRSHTETAKTQLREVRDSFFKTYQKPMEGIPATLFD